MLLLKYKYKAMKRLLILMLLVVALGFSAEARSYRVGDVPNVQLADYRRYVSNPDGILSAEAVSAIDAICLSLKERGVAEVSVVALQNIEPQDCFEFAVSLFEKWGVGDDELDNGLGILLVEDLREVRFVTGYGLEGVLPDALCYRIQQEYMVPYFREGDYSQGMVEGVKAIDTLLSGEELPLAEEDESAEIAFALIVTLLCVLMPLIIIIHLERVKSKCPKCGKHTMRVVSSMNVDAGNGVVMKVDTLRCTNCGHERTIRSNRNSNGGGGVIIFPMGGGGRSGGFGGGSFGGGFGGGSFGGGGSGSSW